MIEQGYTCVIDASVALKLFFERPLLPPLGALVALLWTDDSTRFFVPDLFYAECANVFTTNSRQAGYTAAEAREDMEALLALRLHIVPTAGLAAEALDISLSHRISGYDACYIALSNRIQAPLITADEKLVRAVAGQGYRVQSLAAWAAPPGAASE